MSRRKGTPLNGWVILDKPYGLGSTPALGQVRYLLQAQKAGHGGTLDPLATGVLPIALGEATKMLPYLLDSDKTYQFTVAWGHETNTDDLEGETTATSGLRPSVAQVEAAIPRFQGPLTQVPPAYSAIKIGGRPAYALARKGEAPEMAARSVTVRRLQLVDVGPESATFQAEVSKGTYIRALARDLGRALGCLGHVTALRRLKAGPFDLSRAVTLETLEKAAELGQSASLIGAMDLGLDGIPAVVLTPEQAAFVRQGRPIRLEGPAGLACLKDQDGRLVSMVDIDAQGAVTIRRNINDTVKE